MSTVQAVMAAATGKNPVKIYARISPSTNSVLSGSLAQQTILLRVVTCKCEGEVKSQKSFGKQGDSTCQDMKDLHLYDPDGENGVGHPLLIPA